MHDFRMLVGKCGGGVEKPTNEQRDHKTGMYLGGGGDGGGGDGGGGDAALVLHKPVPASQVPPQVLAMQISELQSDPTNPR